MSTYGKPAYDFGRIKPMAYQESDAEAAEKYRLAQAEELLVRFEDARGRPPKSIDELSQWAASRPDAERPIKPRSDFVMQSPAFAAHGEISAADVLAIARAQHQAQEKS